MDLAGNWDGKMRAVMKGKARWLYKIKQTNSANSNVNFQMTFNINRMRRIIPADSSIKIHFDNAFFIPSIYIIFWKPGTS